MDFDKLYDILNEASVHEGADKEAVTYAIMECVETLSQTSKNEDCEIMIAMEMISAAIAVTTSADSLYPADSISSHLQEMGIQVQNQVKRVRNNLPPSANDDIVVL